MGRVIAFLYGVAAYVLFLATFAYAGFFVAGLVVPKTIDTGRAAPPLTAAAIDLGLMALFAIQHSAMARRSFKRRWTRLVPPAVERSTYVLFSTAALALLLWQWRPIPVAVWQVRDPGLAAGIWTLAALGWAVVGLSTFLISHFELFGLSQVMRHLMRRAPQPFRFQTPLFYRLVRHPLYLGFTVAFWAAPVMSAGHLLFAAVATAYIFVGARLEERDLVADFGEQYRRYQARVPMIFPWRKPM
jgi:protein-S-isoprenylcysteine O-methyltransferase Ste14